MFEHIEAETERQGLRCIQYRHAGVAGSTHEERAARLPTSISFSLPLGFVGRKVDSSKKTKTGHTDRHADRNTESHKKPRTFAVLPCLPPCCGVWSRLEARDKQNDAVRCRRYGLCAAIVRGAPS